MSSTESGETPLLVNSGLSITDTEVEEQPLSDETRAPLHDDAQRSAAVGADLSRLPDDEFEALFGSVLERMQAAAAELPAPNRTYIIGLETDDSLIGEQIDLGSGEPAAYIQDAELLFAYAFRPEEEDIEFAHLAESLEDIDYLLLAAQNDGVLAGVDTSMEELRRELAMTQARRITLLGEPLSESDKQAYQQAFRRVFAAPLTAYEHIVNHDDDEIVVESPED